MNELKINKKRYHVFSINIHSFSTMKKYIEIVFFSTGLTHAYVSNRMSKKIDKQRLQFYIVSKGNIFIRIWRPMERLQPIHFSIDTFQWDIMHIYNDLKKPKTEKPNVSADHVNHLVREMFETFSSYNPHFGQVFYLTVWQTSKWFVINFNYRCIDIVSLHSILYAWLNIHPIS